MIMYVYVAVAAEQWFSVAVIYWIFCAAFFFTLVEVLSRTRSIIDFVGVEAMNDF